MQGWESDGLLFETRLYNLWGLWPGQLSNSGLWFPSLLNRIVSISGISCEWKYEIRIGHYWQIIGTKCTLLFLSSHSLKLGVRKNLIESFDFKLLTAEPSLEYTSRRAPSRDPCSHNGTHKYLSPFMLTRAEVHNCPPDPSGTGPFLLSSVALHGTLSLRFSEGLWMKLREVPAAEQAERGAKGIGRKPHK